MMYIAFKYWYNRNIIMCNVIWALFFCLLPEITICQVSHKVNFVTSDASFSTKEGEYGIQ